MEDFNAYLSSGEKRGGRSVSSGRKMFQSFIQVDGLKDLGFKGPQFTWRRGTTFERLDTAIGNFDWLRNFPDILVFHLPRLKSDHKSLLLSKDSSMVNRPSRPFRFLAYWVQHPSFRNFVRENWNCGQEISTCVGNLSVELQKWNKEVYGPSPSYWENPSRA